MKMAASDGRPHGESTLSQLRRGGGSTIAFDLRLGWAATR